MATNFFYVYALKDPRVSPARAFYIGKGTGSRAFDHLVAPDATKKYARIKEILESATKPMVDILVEDLTEAQALRLEAELIAAFGTIETGGLLTNAVVPSGLGGKRRTNIVVPQGSVDKFQGQEAPVCILSLGSSYGEYGARGLAFLLNQHRINVAISRAQCMTIVVADPRIAESRPASLDDMTLLNLFCKLATPSTTD